MLILLMMPFEILLLPMYRALSSMRMPDSYFGVIMPYLVPACMVFFFRQHCSGLPREFIEAGRIDGCTDYGIFLRSMIPAIGAMSILSAMNSWSKLLWPLIVLSHDTKFTLPIGLGTTIKPYDNAYDVLMPGAVMAAVPIIIVYLFCQKSFVAGMTADSVKG